MNQSTHAWLAVEAYTHESWCGEERFWKISRAIMTDAASAIAMFWQDAWCDFVKKATRNEN
jgi:hypothetical protein